MERRLGFSDPAGIVGQTDADLFAEEHASQALRDEHRIIQTSEAIVVAEEKETWFDGHETWVSTANPPLRDEAGNVVGAFGISRDGALVPKMESAPATERNLLRSATLTSRTTPRVRTARCTSTISTALRWR